MLNDVFLYHFDRLHAVKLERMMIMSMIITDLVFLIVCSGMEEQIITVVESYCCKAQSKKIQIGTFLKISAKTSR